MFTQLLKTASDELATARIEGTYAAAFDAVAAAEAALDAAEDDDDVERADRLLQQALNLKARAAAAGGAEPTAADPIKALTDAAAPDLRAWLEANADEVLDAIKEATLRLVEDDLRGQPQVVRSRRRESVRRDESAWSGKSGVAGDGDFLQRLEVTYEFPAVVRLEWTVNAPVALVRLVDGNYDYPREPDLTDLVSVDESAEYTPEDGPLDRKPLEYYALLTGQFVRLDFRAAGGKTVISATYTVSGSVLRVGGGR